MPVGWDAPSTSASTLPLYFDSKTSIEGIEAGDLFSLNSILGSSIEVQVVTALNRIRDTWDPPLPGSTVGRYAAYGFVRMPQSYPDVRLQKAGASDDVLLGLELKGWYLLSKGREPSYRFKATPLAAAEWDLLVVVPWYLQNVLSGRPAVLESFVKPARWAEEYRNWYWEWERGNPRKRPHDTRGVSLANAVTPPPPYPMGKTEMSDKPKEDKGDNFGRLSGAGVMDSYIERLLGTTVSGIAARDWIAFFTLFTESSSRDEITAELRKMDLTAAARRKPDELAIRTLSIVRELLAAVEAARLDEVEGEHSEEGAMRAAIEDRRRDLEDMVRVGRGGGIDAKEAAKLAGLTPKTVEKIAGRVLEGSQEAGPPPPMPGGDVAG